MSIWEALVLGVIQGLTEFLPVSSSGHLELASELFGIDEPNNFQFSMAVHLGTVLSTIVVFARELGRIFKGLFKFRLNDETIFVINIVISMLPILFVGLMFKDQISDLFEGNLTVVGSMLILTAGLLAYSYYKKPGHRRITPKSAFVMGIAQAIAVFPGLSRSGATISAALIQGVDRAEAAKFSFLMVLVPIIGMNFLQFMGHGAASEVVVSTPAILTGFFTAFVVGLFACKWMVKLVSKGKLVWFAVYCLAVGIFALVYSFV